MKLRIISVGRVRDESILALESLYMKRLGRFCSIDTVSIGERAPQSLSPEETKAWDSEALLKVLNPKARLWALDEHGKEFTSKEFAKLISISRDGGEKQIDVVIGGAYGLAPQILDSAKVKISLSPLTFPFQIARMLFIEQLYRASTIIQNIPYHKA